MAMGRACFLFLVALLATASEANAKDAGSKELDAYIEQSLKDWEVPGLALAVVKGDTVTTRGYGVRKAGGSAAVDEKTIFAIASCTKAFTAAALAMLVDAGQISWDDPVSRRLRNFQLFDEYATKETTIRDLLCHRAGLPRYDLLWYASDNSRDQILAKLRFARPGTSFRSQFGYQNIMYLAAGQVIPSVTGKSWDEFVTDRIFTPLGMDSTNTRAKSLEKLANVATPHARLDDKLEEVPYRNLDNAGPAGAINSNAVDMAKWIRFQLNDGVTPSGTRLITSKSMREMHTPQVAIHPEGMGPEGRRWDAMHPGSRLLSYGFGWVLREYSGRVIVQHGGSLDGMRSVTILVPEEKLGFTILTNRGGQSLPEAIGQRILDMHLGGKPRDWSAEMLKVQKAQDQETKDGIKRAEANRIKDTKPSLPPEKFAGVYNDSLYGNAEVVSGKDGLELRFGKGMVGKMEHWHYDTYRVVWNDRLLGKDLVIFRLNFRGEADELRMPSWNVNFSARRGQAANDEPAVELKPEELAKYVARLQRAAPPLEISVELLDGRLKFCTFGEPIAALTPLGKGRFRVESGTPSLLEFQMVDGKVKQATLTRGEAPGIILEPK